MHAPPLPLALACTLAALASSSASASSLASQPRGGFLQDVLSSRSAAQNYCKPTGQIHDACCDYETVESVNEELFGRLHELVADPYFRYHKVDLAKECPFWEEDGSCMNRACGVETTDEDHIPEAWRSHALGKLNETSARRTSSPAGCSEISESDFCVLEDELDSEGVYVDLLENPERFTGYAGPSSARVWKAIYEENCFTPVPFVDASRPTFEGGSGFAHVSSSFGGALGGGGGGMGLAMGGWGESEKRLLGSLAGPRDPDEEVCLEKRVFYRVISGLHASISVHICDDYLDQQTGKWAPNLDCFITRIGQHPERLENMYFTYVLLLRALSRAGPQLVRTLDDTAGGADAHAALERLVSVADGCPSTFDETSMFSGGKEAELLKSEFKDHFRNVSRIMDCVGCDKCRLWGKMQVTGLGTALKLLFSYDSSAPIAAAAEGEGEGVTLSRSELVAFINTLHRLSESLAAVDRFRTLWAHRGDHGAEKERPKEVPAPASKKAKKPDEAPEPLNSAPTAAPSTHAPARDTSPPARAENATALAGLWARVVRLGEGGWSACVQVLGSALAGVRSSEGKDEL
ncbi:endoplasmic oxidoreductin-1 [Rhodotorula kratochvilovae]